MTSLYDKLGVDEDATPEEIAKKYRSESLKHHPDRGGDADRFREITVAYEVLSDPGKRGYYDATGGETPSGDVVLGLVIDLLNTVIGELVAKRRDPEKVDLVEMIRMKINELQANMREEIAKHTAKAKKLRAVADRFKTDGGDNILEQSLLNDARKLDQQITSIESRISTFDECKEMLDSYSYEQIVESGPSPSMLFSEPAWARYGATSTSSGYFGHPPRGNE